jgi:hypothetical protein
MRVMPLAAERSKANIDLDIGLVSLLVGDENRFDYNASQGNRLRTIGVNGGSLRP